MSEENKQKLRQHQKNKTKSMPQGRELQQPIEKFKEHIKELLKVLKS